MAKKSPSSIGVLIPVIVAGIMELGKIIVAWIQSPATDGQKEQNREENNRSDS